MFFEFVPNQFMNYVYPMLIKLLAKRYLCTTIGIRMNSKQVLALLISIFCLDSLAFGYLDPGSGSYILQMLVAGLLGSVYAIKLYWAKIVNFFKGKSESDDDLLQDDE